MREAGSACSRWLVGGACLIGIWCASSATLAAPGGVVRICGIAGLWPAVATQSEVTAPQAGRRQAAEGPATGEKQSKGNIAAREVKRLCARLPLQKTGSGLGYFEIRVGSGRAVRPRDNCTIRYTAWLGDETEVSSSQDFGGPIKFRVGAAKLIAGLDEGVQGMRVGGRRLLVIPSHLAYGPYRRGRILGDSTLYVDVAVLDLESAPPPPPMPTTDAADWTTTDSGLKYVDLVVGEGPLPDPTSIVTYGFRGWLADTGKYLGSSEGEGHSKARIALADAGIDGFVEGIGSMRVGGTRRLLIPAKLAFGAEGNDSIPPDATLLFEIDLLKAEEPPPIPKPTPARPEDTFVVGDLKYMELKLGTGPETVGDRADVQLHYRAWLADDLSLVEEHMPPDKPVAMRTDQTMLPALREGVRNMKKGGKRQLVVPPELAYGDVGAKNIPPHATLIYEVELVDFQRLAPVPRMPEVDESALVVLSSDLKYHDFATGDGAAPESDATVTILYDAWLPTTGGWLEGTSETNEPVSIPLPRALPGWIEGIAGSDELPAMQVGGKRLLYIPAYLGFGEAARPGIPANSELVCLIELLEVKNPPGAPETRPEDSAADAAQTDPAVGTSTPTDPVPDNE